MDRLPCFCAAVRVKRGELHKAAAPQSNHRRKSCGHAILMLIGIIAGVLSSVGEAVILFTGCMWNKPTTRILSAEGNSKVRAYWGLLPLGSTKTFYTRQFITRAPVIPAESICFLKEQSEHFSMKIQRGQQHKTRVKHRREAQLLGLVHVAGWPWWNVAKHIYSNTVLKHNFEVLYLLSCICFLQLFYFYKNSSQVKLLWQQLVVL